MVLYWYDIPDKNLTFGVVDRAFFDDLTPEQMKLARELLRPNLGLKYTHIIEGAAEFATWSQCQRCGRCAGIS